MEMQRLYLVITIFAFALALIVPSIHGQVAEPAPAPSSDGIALDQGVAYVLMLVALAITYIIH
ncbi:hypothetical protein CASFOL_030856 [Castilleja foliolosa]|uniref:Uncharacterized protein n=1 Tax=Castilleja foliolosa TaxID=1961234 RepID=A0ABD3C741_9LAMI